MIVDFLKNHQQHIPALANIWHDVLGKIWAPEVSISAIEQRFMTHCHDNTLPLTALH